MARYGSERVAASCARRHMAAFTAIELLIAIALSLLIALSAFALFRTAAQTVSICSALSAENAAMRDGFIAAMDDLDFWHSADAIEGPTGVRLVRTDGSKTWLNDRLNRDVAPKGPFSPLIAANINPASSDRVWGWFVDDPHTWYRLEGVANAIADEQAGSNFWRYGDHTMLQRATVNASANHTSTLPNVIHGIWDNCGVYAMGDLLPAGTIFTYYTSGTASNDIVWWRMWDNTLYPGGVTPAAAGAIPAMKVPPSNVNTPAMPYASPKNFNYKIFVPVDLSRVTSLRNKSVLSFSPRPADLARDVQQELVNRPLNVVDTVAGKQAYLDHCRATTVLTPSRPGSGIELAISMRRGWMYNRHWAYCAINIFNANTGRDSTLSFNCTGTTLRGARQHRDIGVAVGARLNR